MILTAEHILRIFGKHKRFIRGRKTIKPNTKAATHEQMDEFEEELKEEVDAIAEELDELEKGPEEMGEDGQEKAKEQEKTEESEEMEKGKQSKGELKCLQCFMQCISGLTACFLRFFVWIFFAFKEFMYQLWEGERYDTLEVLEALNPDLVRHFSTITLHLNNPLLLAP